VGHVGSIQNAAGSYQPSVCDSSILVSYLLTLQRTNAIKFTKGQPIRKITVELGSSWARPPTVWEQIAFKTDETLRTDVLDEPGWGNGTKAYLWIKVKDTGCGMTVSEQKKLFARFSQTTPRTHVKYGGSGLGLFISKTLATMQGGAIGVSSKKDVGSTFAFFAGTRVCDPPTEQSAGYSSRVRPDPSKRAMSFEDDMKAVKLSVLVVEDNLVNQKVLKKLLQKIGWDIHVAGDGQEALDWLKGSAYWRGEKDTHPTNGASECSNDASVHHGHELDLILLDIEMPVLDGLTCARQIRDWEHRGLLVLPPTASNPENSRRSSVISPVSEHGSEEIGKFRIPILAVSANARMERIQDALRAGMDDAITKPFRIPELWPKMQGLIPGLSDR
jgi:CheY-like chemotaxis protein